MTVKGVEVAGAIELDEEVEGVEVEVEVVV